MTLIEVPADGLTVGEVMVKGNIVMKGYLGNEKATRYVTYSYFFAHFFPTDIYCLFLIFPSFLTFREKGSISQLEVILLLM